MVVKISAPVEVWKLIGYDTFDDEWYSLDAVYGSEDEALKHAKLRFEYLELVQPKKDTGGQDGVQDQIHLVDPQGNVRKLHPDSLS